MLEKKILKTIKKYDLIKNGDNIVVGVSGGPDSMTLLNVLINITKNTDLKFNIIVAHVNHMLRKEADEETKYVQNFCKENDIPCYVKRADVNLLAKESKIGTEEAGRNLRYSFFDEVIEKLKNEKNESASFKIATAHNANDNVETVLMNIIRGSGTAGLKGIEAIRDNKYIRPLIKCERKEIEEYCTEKNLNPQIDKTNSENTYTRNKTRNMLIPYIEENFNPNIISSLNRLSELARNENEYIENKVKEEYKRIVINESINNDQKQTKKSLGQSKVEGKNTIILDLKEFNKLDLVIKNRMMIYTICRTLGNSQNIEKVNIEDLVKLCNNNIGNKYLTPNKNIKVSVGKRKNFF